MQVPRIQVPFSATATATADEEEASCTFTIPEELLHLCSVGNTPKGRWYVTINGIQGCLIPDGTLVNGDLRFTSTSSLHTAGYYANIILNSNTGYGYFSIGIQPDPFNTPFPEDITAEIIKWVEE